MKISVLTSVLLLLTTVLAWANPLWEHQIKDFEKQDRDYGFQVKKSLFIGSSSIRMWDTKKYFKDTYTINRGFGGSTVSDILDFYERILKKYDPLSIVLYSGENDLQTKTAKRVHNDFKVLIEKIRMDLPHAKILWILIKKSPARKHLNNKIEKLNSLIKRDYSSAQDIELLPINKLLNLNTYSTIFFKEDNLHFNHKAYQIISNEVKRIHPLP